MNRYAIMVVDVLLVPMSSGNRLRIIGFLQALRRLDWRIGLVTVRDSAPLEQLRELVDEVSFVPARRFPGGALTSFDARPFCAAVTALAAKRQPGVVIAQYAWLGPALAELDPAVQRWIDCHDLLHERTERFAAAGLDSWVQCTWAEERERLAFADVLICCQERDRDRLSTLVPEKQVVSVMTPVDVPPGFVPRAGTGSTVLTVGAFHDGNLAVPDFAGGAWDRVVQRVPGARLRVVGGISETVAPRSSVDVLGIVDRLDEHYADAAVVVCPVSAGSGVKTKMLEALRYGKAVVTTELGAEGMPACTPPAWVTTPSLDACADAVAELLIDGSARAALERAAFAFAERTVSGTAFAQQIGRLLPSELPPMAVPQAEPAVSVIVTQVRSWRDLRRCLRTLSAQTYPPFQVEIIVIVRTYNEALWAAIRRDFSHVVLVCASAGDVLAERRAGADHAHGDFIAFIDADCRADDAWLERAVMLCEHHDRRAIVAEDVRADVPAGANGYGWYDALVLDQRAPGEAFLAARAWWDAHGSPAGGLRSDGAGVVRPSESRVVRHVATGPRMLEARARDADRVRPRPAPPELIAALTDRRVPNRARPAMALAALRATRRRGKTEVEQAGSNAASLQGGRRRCDSVSVIIPSLGRPASLEACLRSVTGQVLDVPFEIVVVISGPAPAPHDDADWPGVRFVHEPLPGPAAARNAGVAAARGDVIAFIDADCVAQANWLGAALATLRDAGSHTIIAGAITRPPARGNWIALYDRATYLRQHDYVVAGGCVTANLIVHREIFDRVGPFDTTFDEAAYEDWDWAMRARSLGVPLAFAKAAVVLHPCMSTAAELKRKAERLARGNLLMRHKNGRPVAVEPLAIALGRAVVRAMREPRAGAVQRAGLVWIGARVAVWSRRAARDRARALSG